MSTWNLKFSEHKGVTNFICVVYYQWYEKSCLQGCDADLWRIVLISQNKLVPSSEGSAWLLRWWLCHSFKHQERLARSRSVAYQNTWVLCSTAVSSQGLAHQWSVHLWRNLWLWKVKKNTHWAYFALSLCVVCRMKDFHLLFALLSADLYVTC